MSAGDPAGRAGLAPRQAMYPAGFRSEGVIGPKLVITIGVATPQPATGTVQLSARGHAPIEMHSRAGSLVLAHVGEQTVLQGHASEPLRVAAVEWETDSDTVAAISGLASGVWRGALHRFTSEARSGPLAVGSLASAPKPLRLWAQQVCEADFGALQRAYLDAKQAELSVLLAHLLVTAGGTAIPAAKPPSARLKQAALEAGAMIDADPAFNWRIAVLARIVGCNEVSFRQAFKRVHGLTVFDYLVARRMQASRSLIRQGMPLTQVALEAGYAGQSQFSRAYRRYFGVAPGWHR